MFLGLESGFRDSLGRSRDVSGLAVFTASWGARSHGRLPARRQPGPPGLGHRSQLQGGAVLFPFEASPGPCPHPQLMLLDLHLFLHGHAK